MTKTIKPIISIIFTIVLISILLWVVLSYIEVIAHNTDLDLYNYSTWNCFTIFFEKIILIH